MVQNNPCRVLYYINNELEQKHTLYTLKQFPDYSLYVNEKGSNYWSRKKSLWHIFSTKGISASSIYICFTQSISVEYSRFLISTLSPRWYRNILAWRRWVKIYVHGMVTILFKEITTNIYQISSYIDMICQNYSNVCGCLKRDEPL